MYEMLWCLITLHVPNMAKDYWDYWTRGMIIRLCVGFLSIFFLAFFVILNCAYYLLYLRKIKLNWFNLFLLNTYR